MNTFYITYNGYTYNMQMILIIRYVIYVPKHNYHSKKIHKKYSHSSYYLLCYSVHEKISSFCSRMFLNQHGDLMIIILLF